MPPAFLTKGSNRGRFETERGGDAARVKDTIQLLIALSGDAAVKHEARLRSGVARVMLDQPTEARADLEAALSSPDPAIRYVARLVLGAIEDHASRPLSALEHYRQAHQTIAASASSIALASLLYRLGRYSEAADVVAAFAQHEPPPDPWRLYGQRDYRFFPEFRAHMRQEVTRIR